MPFNILINGGGIAGPSLAFWLAAIRYGHHFGDDRRYVLAHEIGSAEGDFTSAFDRYQRLMAPFVARCQRLAVDAVKADRFSSGPLVALRNVGLRLLRIPVVRQLVIRQSLAVARSFTLPGY